MVMLVCAVVWFYQYPKKIDGSMKQSLLAY